MAPRKQTRESELVQSCFLSQEVPGEKYSKRYTCRYCSSFKDNKQDSITRLVEHVTCMSTSTGRPVRGCNGAVPTSIRTELQQIIANKRKAKSGGVAVPAVEPALPNLSPGSDARASSSNEIKLNAAQAAVTSGGTSSVFPLADDADFLLVKAFVSGCLAFRFVENPYFVQFCKALCPTYQLPSRKRLVSKIDGLHQWVQDQKQKLITGQVGTLSSDGATMHDLNSFRNYFFITEPEARALHIHTKDLGEDSKSAAVLLAELEHWVGDVRSMGGVCKGVTTDNAAVEMLSTAKLELKDGSHWLPSAGCKEHAIELLLSDVLGGDKKTSPAEFADLVKPLNEAHELSKFFLLRPRLKALHRRVVEEAAAFQDLPPQRKQQYYKHVKSKTFASKVIMALRFLELQDVTRYLCRHRLYLQRVSDKDRAKAREVADAVNTDSGQLYARLEASLKVFRPILAALRKLDCTSSLLCATVDIWELMIRDARAAIHGFGPAAATKLDEIIGARSAKHLGDIEHGAHLLRPQILKRKSLESFTEDQQVLLHRLFLRAGLSAHDGVSEYVSIIEKAGHWATVDVNGCESQVWANVERMRPLSWYQLFVKKDRAPNLLSLGCTLCTLKASQAVSERGWSLLDCISTSRRKRLNPDRLSRLVDSTWFLVKSDPNHQPLEVETTDDEALSEVDGPDTECAIAQCLGLDDGLASTLSSSAHEAAARPYMQTLCGVKRKLDSLEGPLLSAPLAEPYLEELLPAVVTRSTLLKSQLVPIVAKYVKHPSMEIRILAKRVKGAWKEIFAGRTQSRCVLEYEGDAAVPPAADNQA